jgi:DNA-binding NarL/FixJ family response regulator
MKQQIKVLVADDQEVVRKGMVALLQFHEDITIVGEAAHGEEACAMAKDFSPDVVLMDIRMPVQDGIAATQRIREQTPDCKILIMTTFDDDDLVVKALRAGASGYLLKNTPSDQIAKGIRTVFDGNMFLGQVTAQKVVSQLALQKELSQSTQIKKINLHNLLNEREIEILKLIGQGKNNKEIANLLHITEGTTKNYVSRIFSQLDARDRIQAALIARALL